MIRDTGRREIKGAVFALAVAALCAAVLMSGCGSGGSSSSHPADYYYPGAPLAPTYRFLSDTLDTSDNTWYSYVVRNTGSAKSLVSVHAASPRFAPDAHAIAYIDHNRTPNSLHIVNQNHITTAEHISSLGSMQMPAWNNAGTKIAAWIRSGGGSQYLYIANENASGVTLSQVASDMTAYGEPSWATAGVALVYYACGEDAGGVYRYDVAAATSTLIHDAGAGNDCKYSGGQWNADGTTWYASFHDGTDYDMLAVAGDGSGVTLLTSNSTDDVLRAVSPDGTALCYETGAAGSREVYVMTLGTGATRNISNHSSDDYGCVWSNDSGAVYFSSSRNGDINIFISGVSGTATAVQMFHLSGTDEPVDMSPDGATLAFYTTHDGDRDIYSYFFSNGDVEDITTSSTDDTAFGWSPVAY